MSKSTRVFVAFACASAILTLGGTAALAAVVYRAGMVELQVAGSCNHVSVRVPGVVLPVAVTLLPASTLHDAAREVAPYLPAARAAFDELSRCADGVFVEVESRGEHVRIGKKNGVFFIDVRSDGGTVHVSLPLHAVGPVLARLESVARETV